MTKTSFVLMEQPNGSFRQIYCQSNSSPDILGAILLNHYFKKECVFDLISLGDLAWIKHKNQPDIVEVVVAYQRVEEEEIYYNSIDAAISRFRGSGHAYFYVWLDGKWYYLSRWVKNLSPLTQAVCDHEDFFFDVINN